MSAYDPPSESIGVFNSSLFTSTSENITQSYADTHYLKYPTSQSATETITSLIVSNDLTSTNDATINGLTVGKGSGSIISNTVLGIDALKSNTSGNQSIAIGYEALYNNIGSVDNVAVGFKALHEVTNSGNNNTSVGNWALNANTNSNNVGVGYKAGQSNTGGFNNVYVGVEAGVAGGTPNINGDNNTFIGYQSQTSGNSFNNSTALGVGARITASNQIVLGTENETVRYNLLSPLYSSFSSLTNSYIGYTETASNTTIATINTGYQTLMTTSTLPAGIYIYMISQVFQSASTALILETRTRYTNSGGGTANRHITVDSVVSGGSKTVAITGYLNLFSGTGYIDFQAKTSTGTMTAYQTDPDYTAIRMIRIA